MGKAGYIKATPLTPKVWGEGRSFCVVRAVGEVTPPPCPVVQDVF